MVLDAYVNTLFPQEKQKNQTLFISFPLQFLFFFSKFDLSKYEC